MTIRVEHCWLLDKKDEVEEEYRPGSTEPYAELLQAQRAWTGNATNPEKIPQWQKGKEWLAVVRECH